MAKKKILIVDDEPTLNELVKETLELNGYQAISAYNGIEAVKLATEESPDLILLDMALPSGRGEVVYTQLKQLTSTSHIPILIITAENLKYIKNFFEQKGITEDEIFIKPIDFNVLLPKIEAVLLSIST